MGFSKMMELLQLKNKGKIVLCNCGNFYIAVGKDAILLHKLLGLKLSCFKVEVCKIGFPINALEKYTEQICKSKYSFIVYYFDKEKKELEILQEYNGLRNSELKQENNNCYLCSGSLKYYKKDDEYINAVVKLYKKENKSKNKDNVEEVI